jgi:hypothetical protein
VSLEEAPVNQEQTTRIRQRAYELFLERGAAPGGDLRDWLKAEQEVEQQEIRERPCRGPAKMLDQAHHGKLTDQDGCDLENPT